MPISVQTIAELADELSRLIEGMRIDKVSQPQRDLFIFSLRGREQGSKRLLISLNVNDMRVHLTQHVFDNPAEPPMFCMLLRKHLTGARIEAIEQPPSERMLVFTVKTTSAMGDAKSLRIVLELFGRIPNLILADNNGIIIDCLRRIGGDLNSDKRMLLPGLRYHAPAPAPGDGSTAKTHSITRSGTAVSISEQLDESYTRKAKRDNMSARTAHLRKSLSSAKKRILRRLEAQVSELETAADRDFLRESADIIMANIHRILPGDMILEADDFYAQDSSKRNINLNPLMSAPENAQQYYKAYAKAKSAQEHLSKQIAKGKAELEYVDSVLDELSRVESEQELYDIQQELTESGFIKQMAAGQKKQPNKKKTVESKPLQFRSSTGMVIFAGKNNTQNERLTLKSAHKSDIWLHTQKIHGAHVVIKSGRAQVDDVTLGEAAVIAAYYSAARSEANVPVDYTQIKFVKKQPGAHPGMVIYTDFKTLFVTPDEDLVLKLKMK